MPTYRGVNCDKHSKRMRQHDSTRGLLRLLVKWARGQQVARPVDLVFAVTVRNRCVRLQSADSFSYLHTLYLLCQPCAQQHPHKHPPTRLLSLPP